ncbi:PadR family transcriptional regulator [Bacteroidetes bacterium UKL13-3]|jgi:PadR family transcriptional regulator PadR|nr:PadR family transcriptional regulator [Bacteroidetes bacterium UKL13-3]HCP93542.1 PadR family transcriptional regulator [Bacteroidota bacterium]
MNVENSKAQMKKGILELCILSIISRGEVYASDIIEELKTSKMIVVEGTLYPLLTRLKNEGLLSYQWIESKSGPPRKYFQLTEDGKQFLEGLKETWNELVSAVSTVTKNLNTPQL